MENKLIDNQESIDYVIGKHIIENLFGDKLVNIVQRDEFSYTDMLFTASTRHYSTELKMVYTDYYQEDGFLLKMAKYVDAIKDSDKRDPSEGVYALYIVPKHREWYIYNLREIKPSIERLCNKMIKVTQYADSPKVLTTCLILYTNDAIIKGTY